MSQKLNFNIKTQKHYCDNHNRIVFFAITRKILISLYVSNNSSAFFFSFLSRTSHKSCNTILYTHKGKGKVETEAKGSRP